MTSSTQVYREITSQYSSKIIQEQLVITSYLKAKKPYNLWLWSLFGGFIGSALGHSWLYGVGGALLSAFIISFVRPKYKKDTLLAGDITETAILKLSKKYFTKVSYDDFDGMDEDEFHTLFDHDCDDYWSDSQLKGIHNGLKFHICNVEASYEEEYEDDYTDSDGEIHYETRTETVEIFNGSILRIILPFDLKSTITIGNFRSKETMDHQTFNRYYGVESYDRVYTRYLLTQPFMDQMVQLVYLLGDIPKIKFDGKHIYVMMEKKLAFDDIEFFRIEQDIARYEQEIRRINSVLELIGFDQHHILINDDKGTQ